MNEVMLSPLVSNNCMSATPIQTVTNQSKKLNIIQIHKEIHNVRNKKKDSIILNKKLKIGVVIAFVRMIGDDYWSIRGIEVAATV